MGGGTVIKILREELMYANNITAVEKDPVIIQIAHDEFDIKEDKKTKIICDDALKFIDSTTQKYDLIIIDIFIDDTVPKPFLETPFWKDVTQKIAPNGHFLFNSIKSTTQTFSTLQKWLEDKYELTLLDGVDGTNTLLKGKTFSSASTEKIKEQ